MGSLRVLAPLLATTVYFLALAWFLSFWLPEYPSNVNAAFAHRAWQVLAGLSVLLVTYARFTRRVPEPSRADDGAPSRIFGADLFLLLLPMTPIVQYVLNNQDILTPMAMLSVVGFFIVFCLIPCFIVPLGLNFLGVARPTMFLGLSFSFMVTVMPFLSAYHHWLERGRLGHQLGPFAVIFLASLLVDKKVGRRFVYFAVSVFFIINTASQVVLTRGKNLPVANPNRATKLVTTIGKRLPAKTPNIYFLIYDAYVTNETMLSYGIDNSAQEEYLATAGFTFYRHAYSVERYTLGSVSYTLNAATNFYGSARRAASGDGIVLNLLRGFGYRTAGIFWSDYFFRGVPASYDTAFPVARPPSRMLIKSILMGEFRFDAEFDQPSRQQFITDKSNYFTADSKQPCFVYVHDNLPGHSQNSGACLPDETERYAQRVISANREMKKNIDLITRKDPDAIVIVAGDHGPYLTKNCTATDGHYDIAEITRQDLQDRYGTFLAIRWPLGCVGQCADITVLQDIFPAVLSCLFQDKTIENARVSPTTLGSEAVSGAVVTNGIIHGGVNDGEPLFVGPQEP